MAHDTMLGSEIFGYDLRPDQKYKITQYDFKRPDKFSKDQIRTLSIIHETFSRLSTTSLTSMLRSPVHFQVAFVDQMTYEEFIRSIPSPTTIGVALMDPLKGSAILEIDSVLTFAAIDRMLGGQDAPIPVGREISEIECGLIESVFVRMLGDLRESWTPIINLRPRLGQIETLPQFAQIVPPTEMVVLVGMEAKIGEAEGMIRLCIPYITIEPIMSRLTAIYMYSNVKGKAEKREVSPGLIYDLETDAEICIVGEPISLRRLGVLKKGDRIHLPGWKRGDAFVRSGGARVLNLKKQSSTADEELVFSVDEPIVTNLEFLKTEKAAPEADLRRIEEPLARMSGEIARGFESLEKKIGKLSSWHESATDQLEPAPAMEVISEKKSAEPKPFATITRENVDWHALQLSVEHPQLIAMILSTLSFDVASELISRLPESLRPDVIRRVGIIGRVAPAVVSEVDRILVWKLKAASLEEVTSASGIDTAVGILNNTTRSVEKQIIEALEHETPDLAEEIKKRMLVIEDAVPPDLEEGGEL